MKRLLFTLLAGATLVGARAQYTAFPKFSDNWSVTVAGGVVHPLVYEPLPKLLTPSVSIGMKKQLTSAFALGVDVDYVSWNSNLLLARNERSQVYVVGSLNLRNLFADSEGKPEAFEVEFKGSAGWGHIFNRTRRNGFDSNYLVSKWGFDLTYNFGASRRWGIVLRPSLRFDLRNEGAMDYENFNINRAEFDLSLGLTYRFGAKKFVPHSVVPPAIPVAHEGEKGIYVAVADSSAQKQTMDFYDREIANRDTTIVYLKQRITDLEKILSQLVSNLQANKAPVVPNPVSTPATPPQPVVAPVSDSALTARKLETIIRFQASQVTLDSSQFANVGRVAFYLKTHPHSRVKVRGYSSPNGSLAANIRAAKQRAEAVKNLLISQYGISQKRIDADGNGVGCFSLNPEENCVAVCTIVED